VMGGQGCARAGSVLGGGCWAGARWARGGLAGVHCCLGIGPVQMCVREHSKALHLSAFRRCDVSMFREWRLVRACMHACSAEHEVCARKVVTWYRMVRRAKGAVAVFENTPEIPPASMLTYTASSGF